MELAETVIVLLTKKLELFEEILSCARAQNGLSYLEHAVEYDNLIESRRICMNEIDKLNVILKRNLDQIKDTPAAEVLKDRVTALNNKINNVIKEALSLDEQNKEQILKERIIIKNKLQNLRQGRKGVAGYSTDKKVLTAAGAYTDSKR